jgi:alpha-galactosidase
MTSDIIGILTDKEMIAIDQDRVGRQGRRVRDDGDTEVWAKALSGGRVAVALLNKSHQTAAIGFNWNEIDVKGKMSVRDVWRHKNMGNYQEAFIGKGIPSHGVMVLLFKGADR